MWRHISDMRSKHLLPALCLGLLTACGPSETGPVDASCSTRAYASIGGPISLINQDGERVSEADFKGKASLIYFGFTYCPDICPTSLVTINRAIRRLPENIEAPRTILITVDPERDTPEQLKSYISSNAFPEDIVGLTGSEDEIRSAADNFFTDYSRIELPESEAGYTMDHQSIIYLMDEDWTLKTFFTHETDDASMANCLAKQLT